MFSLRRWHVSQDVKETKVLSHVGNWGNSIPDRVGSQNEQAPRQKRGTCCLSETGWSTVRVSGDESRGTVGQGYTGHHRDFGFYSEWNGKPLYGFEMKNDTIGLSFLKNQSACCVENRLGVMWRWKQKRVVRKQLRWPTYKMAAGWAYMQDDSRLNLASAAEAEKSQQILDLFCREHH